LPAEFPQGGVEIADINHVASGVADFDAVADAKRLANQNVNPGDKAFHRGLHSQPDDDGTDTERCDRRVPINKNNGDNDYCDRQCNSQPLDALKGEAGGSIFDSSNCIE
jgi:hypothetical protein